jgi:hypothetical protein
MPITFIVINIPSMSWVNTIINHPKIRCINRSELPQYGNYNISKTNKPLSQIFNTYKKQEYYLLPICINDYIEYNNHPLNIFKNNFIKNLHILNNKSLFAKYMLTNHVDSIPPIIAYQVTDEFFVNQPIIDQFSPSDRLIYRPNQGVGGSGTYIMDELPTDLKAATLFTKGSVANSRYIDHNSTYGIISKYIPHTSDWVGHFLVIGGYIIDKIYYTAAITTPFRGGAIKDYTVYNTLPVSDQCFYQLFRKFWYSGFACADFIIDDGLIKIFEINPRPGGSLVNHPSHFTRFLETLERSNIGLL